MMRDLRGDRLPIWIEEVRGGEVSALTQFTDGLVHDLGRDRQATGTP
jgi:hypothetical protein